MISTQWTTNVANARGDKEAFEQYIANNARLLKRLREILDEKLSAITQAENASTSYTDAGWVYKQAHLNGRRSVLQEIIQLTNI